MVPIAALAASISAARRWGLPLRCVPSAVPADRSLPGQIAVQPAARRSAGEAPHVEAELGNDHLADARADDVDREGSPPLCANGLNLGCEHGDGLVEIVASSTFVMVSRTQDGCPLARGRGPRGRRSPFRPRTASR